jgi:quercetin dioxygenase-like cupin family protein
MFYSFPDDFTTKKPLPGMTHHFIWGKSVMLSHAFFAPGMVHEAHSHPHEQVTMVLKGELISTMGGETRVLKPMDVALIPGNEMHSSKVGPEGCEVIEIFSPPREALINFPG